MHWASTVKKGVLLLDECKWTLGKWDKIIFKRK
jgi:hypothetical protein